MASSRWKRFAFFERQTLTIPPDVWEDLSVRRHTTSTTSSSNEEPQSTAHRTAGATTAVRLTVSTAALPWDTQPGARRMLRPTQNTTTTLTSAAANNNNNNNNGEEEDDSPLSAVNLMWSSLTACTAATPTTTTTTTTTTRSPSEDQPQPPPSLTAPAAVQLLPSQSQSTRSCSNATTVVGDGLVLALVSSPDSALVHCIDLTVRCNPPIAPPPPPTASSAVEGSTTTITTTSTSTTTTNPKKNNTEDSLDGWRGYWNPFVAAGTTATTTIVDTAACRIPAASVRGHSPLHVACLGPSTARHHAMVVWEDPHLHLSCRRPVTTTTTTTRQEDWIVFSTVSTTTTAAAAPGQASQQSSSFPPQPQQQQPWNRTNDGTAVVLDLVPGLVAMGTDAGVVLLYAYDYSNSSSSSSSHSTNNSRHAGRPNHHPRTGSSSNNPPSRRLLLRPYVRIPSPPGPGIRVVSVQLAVRGATAAHAFVAYHRDPSSSSLTTAGICCYDVPWPPPSTTTAAASQSWSAPSARHDLDGRYVGSASLVDSLTTLTTTRRSSSHNHHNNKEPVVRVTVARPDGLYSYSQTERIGVAPIDGTKLAICLIPPPVPAEKARPVDLDQVGYALVASTDAKSGRDAVDIYDATNKLVAFHLLLSPGHRAVQASGVTTLPTLYPDGTIRGGRSSAVVLTSSGALVTLTEKWTREKIALLTQKNLYSAAIVVAYADPSYDGSVITNLYQQYAEHLYRKGDFSGAMEQYMHTIGSLESSHVIFRYLDAPKIPLLVKYLEKLRARELATPVHNELLRTCYLKLNDASAAESIAVAVATTSSAAVHDASLESIVSNLAHQPKDALATICSLEAPPAAEFLVVYGASLARALPRETAGVVLALCLGTYAPQTLADCSDPLGAAAATTAAAALGLAHDTSTTAGRPYPVHLFASAFVEHPKLLRLLLAHCNRHKCPLTPSLRRTLLELTLAEWNHAKRTGDTEAEKLRHKEAIASLTDSHCREIGDYDALVIVQLAGFAEGELLLYERLQMTPMLLERYAKDGSEKSRRQMLAICQTDPEVLADVLGHFVELASERLETHRAAKEKQDTPITDDDSEDDEAAEIMQDIQEALALAQRQNVLPPVRIARILAGEGTGPFRADRSNDNNKPTVPLAVALDYVGTILEESRRETSRLKAEIEEYNELCNSMENEIDALLRASYVLPPSIDGENATNRFFNIDELYTKVKTDEADGGSSSSSGMMMSEHAREAFWREMEQSEDSFDVISRFFAKGMIR